MCSSDLLIRRFDPSFVNVETRVKNGEIGPVHVVKTTARDSPTPTLDYLKISSKKSGSDLH